MDSFGFERLKDAILLRADMVQNENLALRGEFARTSMDGNNACCGSSRALATSVLAPARFIVCVTSLLQVIGMGLTCIATPFLNEGITAQTRLG